MEGQECDKYTRGVAGSISLLWPVQAEGIREQRTRVHTVRRTCTEAYTAL